MEPLISVVIPVHNREEEIVTAVQSVISQSHRNLEVIVSDDGSTDRTVQSVRNLCDGDPRIILLESSQRTGPAAARNRALAVARGRWIAYLDSDDYWLPNKLKDTLAFAQQKKSALTHTGYFVSRRGLPDTSRSFSPPEILTYEQLLRGNQINTSTVLVDSRQVPNFSWNEKFSPEDFVAWLDVLREGHNAHALPFSLTVTSKGKKSDSSNKLRMARRVFRVLQVREHLPFPRLISTFISYSVRGIRNYLAR